MNPKLAELRARIRELEGAPQVHTERLEWEVDWLDTSVGGLVRPGLLELQGPHGSGVVQLGLEIAAAETERRRRVAWVDQERTLYPPTALAQRVDLDLLLLVRPPAAGSQGARHPGLWATEQLLRSGCFRVVITTVTNLPRFSGQRLRQAAEQGGCSLVLLTRRPSRQLQPDVRLQVSLDRLVVARDRQRGAGAIVLRTHSVNAVRERATE